MTLVREMPVNAEARIMQITDKRLWRVVEHYAAKAITRFDLSSVEAVGLDETASTRGHNQVTVFIDMQRRKEPVLFATPGKSKKRQEDAEAVCAVSADTQEIAGGDPRGRLRHVASIPERHRRSAARARARGYRNDATFITMIYMIASPTASVLKST